MDIFKIAGGLFSGIGMLMLTIGIVLGSQQYRILKQWPEVEGTVTASRVGRYQSDRSMYNADIEFRYVVGGTEYITPAPDDYSSSSYSGTKQKVAKYPAGSRHTIKYNPRDPNEIPLVRARHRIARLAPRLSGVRVGAGP